MKRFQTTSQALVKVLIHIALLHETTCSTWKIWYCPLKKQVFKQSVPVKDSVFPQKLPQPERSAYFHHYTSGSLDAAATEQTWHFLSYQSWNLDIIQTLMLYNSDSRQHSFQSAKPEEEKKPKHLKICRSCQTSTKPNHLGELHIQKVKLMTWKTSCN